MTNKEQQSIENLLKAIQEVKVENIKFREDVKSQVEAINVNTEKKHLPIYLEQDILKAAQEAIGESIKRVLSGSYDSPMNKLVKSVVDENSVELRALISDSFTSVIRTDEFQQRWVI